MNIGKIKLDRKWIAAGVAALLIVCYLVILVVGKVVRAKQPAVVTDEYGQVIEGDDPLYGRAELLFYFRDNDGSGMIFTVSARLDEHRLVISALPDDKNYTMNGAAVSFGTVYAGGGLDGVKTAASIRAGVTFDRVYICTPTQFAKATGMLGAVTVNVPEPFSYSDSTGAVNLKAGENSLSGSDLYLYLKHGCGDEISYEMRGDLFTAMIRRYLTTENTDKGEKLFGELVNAAQTDITAYDYSAWAERLAAAAASETLTVQNAGLIGAGESEG